MHPDKPVRVELSVRLIDERDNSTMSSLEQKWEHIPYNDYLENMEPILIKMMGGFYGDLHEMGVGRMHKAQTKGPKR